MIGGEKNSAEFHLFVWPIRRGVEWPDFRYPIPSIGLSEHISTILYLSDR